MKLRQCVSQLLKANYTNLSTLLETKQQVRSGGHVHSTHCVAETAVCTVLSGLASIKLSVFSSLFEVDELCRWSSLNCCTQGDLEGVAHRVHEYCRMHLPTEQFPELDMHVTFVACLFGSA